MRKVTIFGSGRIGVRVAFFLARSREIGHIVLVDVEQERSRSTVLDFLQSNIALQSKITFADYDEPKEMGESDAVIVAVGGASRSGAELDLPGDGEIATMRTIAANIGHFAPQALVAVLSQPAELFCRVVADTGYISPERIIGFPLLMHREWFRREVARVVGVGSGDVRITTVRTPDGVELVRSQTRVSGVPLQELVLDSARDVAHPDSEEMLRRRDRHHYAPAAVVARVVEEIVSGRRQVITCMCIDEATGTFPEAKALIGPAGVEKVIPFDLEKDQQVRHETYREKVRTLTEKLALP